MTTTWTFTRELSKELRLDVLNLLNRTEARFNREAIDEGRRRIVVHGWNAEHWTCYDGDSLVGYAQSSPGDKTTIEMCGGEIDETLLQTVLATHSQVDWWTRNVASDFSTDGQLLRKLLLLDISLPVEVVSIPEHSLLRTFQIGRDEDSWLVQNNEAFANHPEQGAWIRADLEERTHEPWFDPSGFLLLEIDGRIAASCWTKVHELNPERFGEIYVISVHPQFQGRNLGRIMVTQGLRVLREKGVQRAKLFVDESNSVALQMYFNLGFQTEREDQLIRFTA